MLKLTFTGKTYAPNIVDRISMLGSEEGESVDLIAQDCYQALRNALNGDDYGMVADAINEQTSLESREYTEGRFQSNQTYIRMSLYANLLEDPELSKDYKAKLLRHTLFKFEYLINWPQVFSYDAHGAVANASKVNRIYSRLTDILANSGDDEINQCAAMLMNKLDSIYTMFLYVIDNAGSREWKFDEAPLMRDLRPSQNLQKGLVDIES